MHDGDAARLPDQDARTRIVDDLDTCFLVEAGAGSGKTHSLVSRMVSLIATGRARTSGIAAITFTRKAAAELRERFQIRLEAAAASERDPVRRARLQEAVATLDEAFLGTIHSFCARLLRERPVEAGLDPAFEELEEDEAERWARRAWESYLEEVRREAPQRLESLRELGVEPQELYGLFLTLHRYPDVEPVTAERPRPDLRPVREALARYLAEAMPLLPRSEPAKGWDDLQRLLRRVDQEFRFLRAGDDPRLIEILAEFERRPEPTKNRWPDKETAEEAWGRFQAFAQTTAGPALRAWREFLHRPLMDFVRPAVALAARMRQEAGKVSFEDLLLKAAELLREHPEVRRGLGERYTHLLVDEFQDTDPIQAEVLFLLTGEPLDERDWRKLTPRPGSLFVVGDPKQSIYRFRRADIDVYQQVKELLVQSGGEVLQLSANFRSVAPLIGWVNQVFARHFPEKDDRFQPAYVPLIPVRAAKTELPPVQVLELPPVARHAQEGIAREDAARVAAWIAWACAGGLELARAPEERARGLDGRPRPGDFLVLHWDRAYLLSYAEALEARGIPAEVTGAKGYAGAWEVAAFLDLLAALADPADPVKLLAVLRGPLFGLSDPALYELARELKGDWTGLLDRPVDGLPDPIREALATLQRWQAWTESLPPQAALEAILEDTGLFPWTAALPAGAARAGNLVKLVEAARAAGAGLSFPRLVDRLLEVVQQQELEAGSLFPGRPQAVRVMNLHRAKGLEAPVVVLAYPAGVKHHPPAFHIEREGERARGAFLIQGPSQNGPWGTPRLLGVPPGWDEAAALEERYQAAEDMRLLYVAATRARELLVISRYPAKPEKSPWHALAFNGALDGAPVLPEPSGPAPVPEEVPVDPGRIDIACREAAGAMEQARTPTSLHLTARDLVAPGPAQGAGAAGPEVLDPVAAAQEEAAAAAAWTMARSALEPPALEMEDGEDSEAGTPWRPDEALGEPGGVAWGRAFHRFMELMVREGRTFTRPGSGQVQDAGALLAQAEALARYVGQEEGLALDAGADPARVLLGWAEPLVRSDLWRRVMAARRVEVEVPLALALPAGELARLGEAGMAAAQGVAPDTPAVVQGQADLLFQEEDGWVLVDYKTDRLPAGPAGGAALAARYAPQITAYAEAWHRVTGEPVKERWLYLVRSGETVPVP